MSGLLADLFSTIDSKKRQLRGLLDDPLWTIQQGIRNFGEDQRKLTGLQAQAYPWTAVGGDPVSSDPAKIAAAQKALADQAAQMGMAAATVWHGSPHTFDKFDSRKIGTGEGAQAYGHGLYLAENPKVAREYIESNGAPQWIVNGETLADNYSPTAYAAKLLGTGGTPPAQAVSKSRDLLSRINKLTPEKEQYFSNTLKEIERLQSTGAKIEKGGSLYKVDLPDEHIARMLDWDKPLSQQHPDVQKVISNFKTSNIPSEGLDMGGGGKILANHNGQVKPDSLSPWVLKSGNSLFDISQKDVERMLMADKGEAAYTRMTANLGGQPQATEALRNAGIPGIRYLDGGSRGAGSGTSNYVVFPGNEDILTILERNGKGLLGP